MKKFLFLISLFCLCVVYFNFKSVSSSSQKSALTIGSKNFTESIVLAHMMADIIEAETDLKVERKVNLGGSNIALKALLNKEIHMYPEYTATILLNLYPEKTPSSQPLMERIRKALEQDSLELSTLFGFSNSYELAVKKGVAKKYNLKSIQDVKRQCHNLRLGCDFEFLDRPDGHHNLCKEYEMEFKKVKGMNRGILFRALAQDAVDVLVAYTTSGQVLINDLTILKDDRGAFPNYAAGALVHQDILKSYPEIRVALAKLEGQISAQEMQELNKKIEFEGLKAREAVHDFLKEKGLIRG